MMSARHRNGAIADVDMRFVADEVRFVDEKESLLHQAVSAPVASAMNSEAVPYDPISSGMSDDFGGTTEFV